MTRKNLAELPVLILAVCIAYSMTLLVEPIALKLLFIVLITPGQRLAIWRFIQWAGKSQQSQQAEVGTTA